MNLLLNSIYRVKGKTDYWYRRMKILSEASYKKNLVGMDKIITITDDREFENENDGYKMVYYKTQEIWKQGHNILFADVDTLCIKPTYIYDRWHDFAMFWGVESEEMYNPVFFCGIRYFPKHLDPLVWRQGEQAWVHFEGQYKDRFDNEQLVYNSMLYSQGCAPRYFLRNRLHYVRGTTNKIPEEKANIIHFPATRGASSQYDQMVFKYEAVNSSSNPT